MWSKDWVDVAVVVTWILVWAGMVYVIPNGVM